MKTSVLSKKNDRNNETKNYWDVCRRTVGMVCIDGSKGLKNEKLVRCMFSIHEQHLKGNV